MLYQLCIYPIELIIQICYSLFYLFTDNAGISLAGVSIAVSLLSLPLYNMAEKRERLERDIQMRMRPKIDKIKAVFKGDERYMMLSAYYRQQKYHPVYALRGSISLLIQVPFFIAAYRFLSHLQLLQGRPFIGIADLGTPDALLKIGSVSLNILPLIMTAINIAAGEIYTRGFSRIDKLKLYAMAILFLALLYTSPAGLVLYWTLNNVFSLIKHIVKKLKNPERILYYAAVVFAVSAAIFVVFFTGKSAAKKILIASIAVFFAAIPLYILFFNKTEHIFLSVLGENSQKRFTLFFITVFSLFILSGIFIPSALVATSPQEFSFVDTYSAPFELLVFPLFQSAGFFLLWAVLLFSLFSDKTKNLLTFVSLLFLTSALINVFIFKGKYGTVLSNLRFMGDIPEVPPPVLLLRDIAVLAGTAVFILCVLKYIPLKIISPLVFFIALSLSISGLYNYVHIQNVYKKYSIMLNDTQTKQNVSEKIEPVYTLSKNGKNVVVLMLDRAINNFVPLIFDELPETADRFKGFTYYPNTVSVNGHTIMASPSLYGGYEYTPDQINERASESLVDKHNEALCVMPRLFAENGFKSGITDPSWANYSWVPDVRIFDLWPDIHAKNLKGLYTPLWTKEHNISLLEQSQILKRNLIFFSFFRMFPAALRGGLYDDGDWWNSETRSSNINMVIDLYSVLDYLPELTAIDDDSKSETNTFACIVNELTHENTFLQYPEYIPADRITDKGKNNFPDEVQHQIYHVNAAALKLVGEWFDYLQKKHVYDNTRIIIVSDHGSAENFPALSNLPSPINLVAGSANALLMVKDFNADFPLKTDMKFMTTADVPFLAANDLIKNPVNPFTKKSIDIKTKESGSVFYSTHRTVPERHNKNTFILDNEEWLIKDNIFDPQNWTKIK